MAGETIISHDFSGLNNGDPWPANRYEWRGTTGVTRDVQSAKGRTSSVAGAAYPGGYHTILDTSVLLEPKDVTVVAPNTATFTADIAGADTYRWQITLLDGTVADIGEAGANTKTFTTSPRDVTRDNGKLYRLSAWHSASPTLKRYTRWAKLTVTSGATAPTGNALWGPIDFASIPLGSLSTSELASQTGPLQSSTGNFSTYLSVVNDPVRGHVQQQEIVPSSTGSPVVQWKRGSASVRVFTRRRLFLGYWCWFDPNFDWGGQYEGGKLPGLAGGTAPTGGSNSTQGFTARFMWRGGGRLVIYAYHQTSPTYGEDFRSPTGQDFFAPRGQWFYIQEEIIVNSGASTTDGEARAWFNGQLRIERKGIQWRADGVAEVDSLYYSVFHGGHSTAWSPSRTNYLRTDGFVIGESFESTNSAG